MIQGIYQVPLYLFMPGTLVSISTRYPGIYLCQVPWYLVVGIYLCPVPWYLVVPGTSNYARYPGIYLCQVPWYLVVPGTLVSILVCGTVAYILVNVCFGPL